MTTTVDNKAFSDFQSRYQYRVLGSTDLTYERVTRSLGDDSLTIDRLKSQRAAMTIEVNALRANTELDQGTINKRVANREMAFIRSAVNALRQVSDEGNLFYMRMAVNSLTQELQRTINTYLASDTRTAEDDASFRESAQLVMSRLSYMNTTLRGRTSSDAGPGFDINLYQASRRLADIRSILTDFPAVTPPENGANDGNGEENVDLLV